MKHFVIGIIIIVLTGIACIVNAETVTLTLPDGRLLQDHNKTGSKVDTNMCWLYAFLNVIHVTQAEQTEASMFEHFKALVGKFGNDGQVMAKVIHWWYYEYYTTELKNMNERAKGEVLYWWYNPQLNPSLGWVKGALLQNTVVILGIVKDGNTGGHVVTCYAYKYENGKRYLAIADSDDNAHGVFWTPLYQKDGKTYLEGYNASIDEAYSFRIIE